ncbi:MAG: N-acetylneuraminate synthase family protein [Nanoarchaeota archaeon]
MEKIEIIAELAQGYDGDPKLTSLLASGAIESDADAVKIQIVYADELSTPDYHFYNAFKLLEMPKEVWQKTVDKIHQAGKKVYFDVYGEKGLELAKELKADGIKLSTTEFYNKELVQAVLKEGFKKVFISVGGIPLPDIKAFIERESLQPGKNICFMFGFQAEPTPLENNNLSRITALQKEFPGFEFGFMDHSLGISEDALNLPLMALSTGISCIEKHLTLDPLLKMEDSISALAPSKFKEFVRIIRKYEPALGISSLTLTPLEEAYRKKAVKVVVAKDDLPIGTMLTKDKIELKRVNERFKENKTINSKELVIGKKINKNLFRNDPILEEALENVSAADGSGTRKLVATLACRNSGARLFGKPLHNLDLASNITVLDQLILSLKKISCIQGIVLGISEGVVNDVFVSYAEKHGISYIRGNEEDVLQRLIQCGDKANATDIFRVTTECPFLYFEAVENAWSTHLKDGNDATVADNVTDSTNFEIIKLDTVKKAHAQGERRHRSELCSLYIRENPQQFKIKNIEIPKNLNRPDIRLSVDYPEDLVLCRAVYRQFKDQAPLVPIQEIIAYLDTRPDLLQLIAPFCDDFQKVIDENKNQDKA